MVLAAHPAVALAGLRVLQSGGNAIDAALAMAALGWVALPGQCGLGGDAFALVYDPVTREVRSFGGSGFGPDGGTPGFYQELGLAALPLEGALAVAVPGALAALTELHATGATRSLAELWAPASQAAARGLPCTVKTRNDILRHDAALAADPAAATVLLPGGAPPEVGGRLRMPGLAATIRGLAAKPEDFYTGDFAERAVATLRAGGAPFTGEEWAATGKALTSPSITLGYGSHTLHQTPMPTPGWMVLQQLGLNDGHLATLPMLSPEAIDFAARAAALSFADRVTGAQASPSGDLGLPTAGLGTEGDAWRSLLAPEVLRLRRADLIAGWRPSWGASPRPEDGDTTSVVAVDSDGRAITLIHSLAFSFGARIMVPGTGVLLNNRLGRGVYLIDGHPNEVAPRRRPLFTLNAWVVTDSSGRLEHIGNTPGGDGQAQWNPQLLSHLLDHGADPALAVGAPRFTVFPGSDADVQGRLYELRAESRFGTRTLERLRELGQNVQVQGAWEAGGSALVVSRDQTSGAWLGAADPRQDGVALGV